jgi:hypothetical protein
MPIIVNVTQNLQIVSRGDSIRILSGQDFDDEFIIAHIRVNAGRRPHDRND